MINKQKFEEAYRKFPPSCVERFFLKYLSMHSIHNNNVYLLIIILFLIIPLIIETIMYVSKASDVYRVFPNIFYAFLMSIGGIFWLIILTKKQQRLKKLRKYLGITKKEFKEITQMYYYNRYSSNNKFIEFNSKDK